MKSDCMQLQCGRMKLVSKTKRLCSTGEDRARMVEEKQICKQLHVPLDALTMQIRFML